MATCHRTSEWGAWLCGPGEAGMAAIDRRSKPGRRPLRGGHGAAAPDYQLIADASPDVTTVAGTDGVYRHVSGACHTLFGWQPEDLEGTAQDEFAHPDDVALL